MKERLLFVWAPLYVGGGASCIPEACMWVVPGFKEGRLLHLRGRRGGRKREVERGRGSRGSGSRPGCLHHLRAPGSLCSVSAYTMQNPSRIVSRFHHCTT